MVDFKYHLVSLISVFLALSVGIILGAGPLQNSIGEALTGQVSGLRSDNQELMEQKDELTARVNKHNDALAAVAPSLLADSLKDRSVGIIRLPNVDDSVYDSAVKSLTSAGAVLGTSVTLTNMWVDVEESAYRSAFASQIRDYLPNIDEAAETNTVLVTALEQLVRKGTSEEKNATLFQLMTESDSPMMKGSGELSDAVEAIVVLAPDQEPPQITEDKSADADAAAHVQYQSDLFVKIIKKTVSGGVTVAVGAANSDEDAVTAVRAHNDVTTVDGPNTPLGELNIAIAVAHALNGETIHVGMDKGASAVVGEPLKMSKPVDAPAEGESADAPAENSAAEAAPAE